MKKIISSVLAFVMIAGLFALIPLPAVAADTTQSTTEVGKVEAGYTPVGTAITTAAEFAAMKANGKYYLNADITIDASYASTFTGTFDGNGHTVTVSVPLFLSLGTCTIKNLTINGSVNEDAEAACAGAIVSTVKCNKKYIIVENVVNNAAVTGTSYAGGFIGQVITADDAKNAENTVVFRRCVNSGAVSGKDYVGGLLGYMTSFSLEISDCENTAAVTAVKGTTDSYAGGIVGYFGDGTKYSTAKSVNIIRCKNKGKVTSELRAGGIVGFVGGLQAYVLECLNEGAISGKQHVGGMVGEAGTNASNCLLSIAYCINTGNVTLSSGASGTKNAGGMAGYVFGSGTKNTSYCKIDRCINLGKITSTWFGSQFLGYSNCIYTTLKDSIAAGSVVKKGTKTLAVVVGLSSASSVKYAVSNIHYLENDGTEYYSYATAKDNASNIVTLETYLKDNAGKITTFTADDLASGKIGAMFNKFAGKDLLYQNADEKVPTTDSTHGKLVDTTPAKTAVKISTADEFAAMEADGNYVLDADITISKTYGTFNGTFDGNGHTIKTKVPLFTKLRGATVKNLVIDGEIKSTGHAGGLSINGSMVRVENVINKANISSTKSGAYVGGLIGAVNEDSGYALMPEYDYFTGCVNYGDLAVSVGKPRVGGLVGNAARFQYCVYTDCVNNGNITAEGTGLTDVAYVAGIAGSSFGGEFINCVNNGNLSSDAPNVFMGGILAKASPSSQGTDQSSTAVGCVNTGNLTIKSSAKSGTLGGIFGTCGEEPKGTMTRAIYTTEKCVNLGTLTNNGAQSGAMIGYIWGSNNTVKYSYGVIRNCVNYGKLVGTKDTNVTDLSAARATFVSHFIGYVNASNTVIENSYGLGKLENAVSEYNVVFGLSGDIATAYKVKNVFLAPDDGTTNYSYAWNKDGNDLSRNRLALDDEKVAGKVTVLTTEDLAGGKVTYTCNELLGKRFFYQNLGTDTAPTTDRTHAPVNLYGDKYFNINEGGASVRVVGDSATVGVRFRSLIKKDIFDAMKADVAEIGVIIAPKAIADAAGEMTFEALDAYKAASGKTNVYLTLKRSGEYATSFSDEELSYGAYAIKGSLVNVKNASMEFTAVGYVKLADGTVFYGSTDTNSAKAVATAAVADTKSAAEAEYMYEVAEGVFSPYTKEAYENLKALANAK